MKSTLHGSVEQVNVDMNGGEHTRWWHRHGSAPTAEQFRPDSRRETAMTCAPAPACPHCGWPDLAEPFQVVSRHTTAAGSTVWTRCGCGSLQVRLVDACGTRVVSRSRPALSVPVEPA
jgi:hypothetical protein